MLVLMCVERKEGMVARGGSMMIDELGPEGCGERRSHVRVFSQDSHEEWDEEPRATLLLRDV